MECSSFLSSSHIPYGTVLFLYSSASRTSPTSSFSFLLRHLPRRLLLVLQGQHWLSLLLLIFSGFWFPLSIPLKDFVTDSARSSMLSWASNFHQVEISFSSISHYHHLPLVWWIGVGAILRLPCDYHFSVTLTKDLAFNSQTKAILESCLLLLF